MKYNKNLSLLLILLIIISLFIVLYKYFKFMKVHNSNVIETFKDELYYDLSDEDKTLYFSIIDTYQLVLQRDPAEDELNTFFTKLKQGKMTLPELFTKLKASVEYKQLNDIQENTSFTTTDVNNDIQDYQQVLNELQTIMPKNDEHDSVYIDFLIMKYRENDKNRDKFRKYLISTPEYSDYIEMYIKDKNVKEPTTTSKSTPEKSESSDNSEYISLKDSANVEYRISPPKIKSSSVQIVEKKPVTNDNKLTQLLEEKKKKDTNTDTDTCEFYNEFQKLSSKSLLADHIHKRNLEQMKYACSVSKEYSNVNSNLVLMPDQKWSVPQKRTPVCHSQNCSLNDSYSQTALIGTLLSDIQNEKILPSFTYKEN